MRNRFVKQFLTVLAFPGVLVLAGCDRSSTELDDDHNEFARVEVVDRGQAARPVVATWRAGEGWSGSLPNVSLSSTNQRISIGFRVYDDDGDQLELAGEYSIRYALSQGATQGIVDMGHADNVLFHGDHVHIYGQAPGTTQIQFVLWHIDHADDATDPVTVRVVN